ncbi:MAG: OmpH family outer membrane protein [Chitinophagaceae bacterium]|nr:OmpH family outer membrane protein [Chitinophagaceae bacterium]
MKYLSVILSAAALVLAGIALYKVSPGKSGATTVSIQPASGKDSLQTTSLKIGYVDLDSIDAKFDFYRVKMEAFEKKKDGLDRQLNGAYQQLDNKRIEFLKKGNAITQAEADAFKKEYDQQLQFLENQRRKTEQEVQQEAMIMRDDIFKKINDYLTGFSKERGYNYIFSYSRNANVFLYQDAAFDVTNEVIIGLNAAYPKTETKK